MEFINILRSGQIDSIQAMLIANPSLANHRDERGFTPLVLATYMGQKEVAEVLIENGAEIDAQDALGNTALMGVCFKGSVELAQMLLDKGASLHITNKEGKTALNFAQEHGHENIAGLLTKWENETIALKSS